MTDPFAPYLQLWDLAPDGAPVITNAAQLLPVRYGGQAAMLKLSDSADQRRGAALMVWWAGAGAAKVFERQGPALLLERAIGTQSLAQMARSGGDDEACRILCAAAARLHGSRPKLLPDLVPLSLWFHDLGAAATTHGGILGRSLHAAQRLLADPREIVVLHGDLHHDNVLEFGTNDWRAIDPNGLIGERGFEFATIFTNPDLAAPNHPIATDPARFQHRLQLVAQAAQIERERLILWVLAWSGLSAAWFIQDGDPLAKIPLRVAGLAAAQLNR